MAAPTSAAEREGFDAAFIAAGVIGALAAGAVWIGAAGGDLIGAALSAEGGTGGFGRSAAPASPPGGGAGGAAFVLEEAAPPFAIGAAGTAALADAPGAALGGVAAPPGPCGKTAVFPGLCGGPPALGVLLGNTAVPPGRAITGFAGPRAGGVGDWAMDAGPGAGIRGAGPGAEGGGGGIAGPAGGTCAITGPLRGTGGGGAAGSTVRSAAWISASDWRPVASPRMVRNASISSAIVENRSSFFLASARVKKAFRAGGRSGAVCGSGGKGSTRTCDRTSPTDSPGNGRRPVSIR